MTTYSDEQLMASLIEEDNLNAFETLLSRYEKPLLIYIFGDLRIEDVSTAVLAELEADLGKSQLLYPPDPAS